MSLNLHLGSTQRSVAQLEVELGEVRHYRPAQRAELARALSDLAVQLELIRLVVLDPGADDPSNADSHA